MFTELKYEIISLIVLMIIGTIFPVTFTYIFGGIYLYMLIGTIRTWIKKS